MKSQVNLQLLTSQSYPHSCLQLDHTAGGSYSVHPENIPSPSPACVQPAFQMPATTAVQESWPNPFSTCVESRRFVSLRTKTGCRSIRMAPRGSHCGMCGNYAVIPTPHIYQNGEVDQHPELLRPLPGLPIFPETLCDLIFLFIIQYSLNISLIHELQNSTMAAYQSI